MHVFPLFFVESQTINILESKTEGSIHFLPLPTIDCTPIATVQLLLLLPLSCELQRTSPRCSLPPIKWHSCPPPPTPRWHCILRLLCSCTLKKLGEEILHTLLHQCREVLFHLIDPCETRLSNVTIVLVLRPVKLTSLCGV